MFRLLAGKTFLAIFLESVTKMKRKKTEGEGVDKEESLESTAEDREAKRIRGEQELLPFDLPEILCYILHFCDPR